MFQLLQGQDLQEWLRASFGLSDAGVLSTLHIDSLSGARPEEKEAQKEEEEKATGGDRSRCSKVEG